MGVLQNSLSSSTYTPILKSYILACIKRNFFGRIILNLMLTLSLEYVRISFDISSNLKAKSRKFCRRGYSITSLAYVIATL